jgi:hypothetical protein
MKTSSVRLLVPVGLTVLGLWLLVGCIYIPGFGRVSSGKDVSGKVGDDRSGRPLRLGAATREDVARVLGEPKFVSTDGHAVAYGWGVTKGYLVNVLCPPASQTFWGARSLVLRFDERGVLRTYELFKGPPPVMVVNGYRMPMILPEDLRLDWKEQQNRRLAEELRRERAAAATRAAPEPATGSGERREPQAH